MSAEERRNKNSISFPSWLSAIEHFPVKSFSSFNMLTVWWQRANDLNLLLTSKFSRKNFLFLKTLLSSSIINEIIYQAMGNVVNDTSRKKDFLSWKFVYDFLELKIEGDNLGIHRRSWKDKKHKFAMLRKNL